MIYLGNFTSNHLLKFNLSLKRLKFLTSFTEAKLFTILLVKYFNLVFIFSLIFMYFGNFNHVFIEFK